ncbi:MAG: hypothetical protein M8357_16845 [Desulfobulbaceae bacterium]|nr:hypothetical protein [Desulfobulbaceae bacterium]
MREQGTTSPPRQSADQPIIPCFSNVPNPHDTAEEREVELFAEIRRSSKYYYQGLDSARQPRIFRIEAIRHGTHPFRLNNNNYRSQDLTFFVKDLYGRLVPLSEGGQGQ